MGKAHRDVGVTVCLCRLLGEYCVKVDSVVCLAHCIYLLVEVVECLLLAAIEWHTGIVACGQVSICRVGL